MSSGLGEGSDATAHPLTMLLSTLKRGLLSLRDLSMTVSVVASMST